MKSTLLSFLLSFLPQLLFFSLLEVQHFKFTFHLWKSDYGVSTEYLIILHMIYILIFD